MLLIMKKNFIGKSILSIAAISLTVSTFAGESHAQTKAEKYNEYQTNFKKQVNKKVVDAQKAVTCSNVQELLQHTVKHKELLT